ncbi:MAG: cupin domain-containing protein [Gulosibacter sp.]|uniref:cupin domain-containing protein n=1 Tax=Gulosibacter sp. TaxID=2817531 RepID=UPI003F93A94F
MEIRRRDRALVEEHHGTIETLFFYEFEELRSQTQGGYLEFADEFRLKAGEELEPHSHNSDEFYFILSGGGTMTIDGEQAHVERGELVRIKPNLIHSISADQGEDIVAFAFAISYMAEDQLGYTAYPKDGSDPKFVPLGT